MAENPLQQLWSSVCDYAWAEGRTIKGAPLAFALGVLLTGGILSVSAWRATEWFYGERIAIQEATIQNLRERLAPTLPGRVGRHLSSEYERHMRPELRLSPNENYAFQINSAISCDECEQFAEELRDFFNSIAGWKAGGSALFFPQPKSRRGLLLITGNDETDSVAARKIRKAFSSAGMRLDTETDAQLVGSFVIIVGRPGS